MVVDLVVRGTRLGLNKRFIVYAKQNDVMVERFKADLPLSGHGIYWTNICTRTKAYDEKEVKELE